MAELIVFCYSRPAKQISYNLRIDYEEAVNSIFIICYEFKGSDELQELSYTQKDELQKQGESQ